MFNKSPEHRIMKVADRMVSMKEDFDAVSWGRVSEIAKLMLEENTEAQRHEWARELQSIARSNTWVLDKFGVAAESMTGSVIASGIEIQEGDQYLSPADAAPTATQPQPIAAPMPTDVSASVVFAQAMSAVAAAPAQAKESVASPSIEPVLSVSSFFAPENTGAPVIDEVAKSPADTGKLPRIPSFGLPEIAPEEAAGVIASLPKLDLFFSGSDAFSSMTPDEKEAPQTPPATQASARSFEIPRGRAQETEVVSTAPIRYVPPIEVPARQPESKSQDAEVLSNLPRAFSNDESEMLSDAERELRALEVMYAMMAAENGELTKAAPSTQQDIEPEKPFMPAHANVSSEAASVAEAVGRHGAVPTAVVEKAELERQVPVVQVPAIPEPLRQEPAPVEPKSAAPQPEESHIETRGALRKKRKQEKRNRREGKAALVSETHVLVPPVPMPLVPAIDSSTAPVQPPAIIAAYEPAQPAADAPATATTPATSAVLTTSATPATTGNPSADQGVLDPQALADFKHVYSGKTGTLSLYEDADGHLVAVDPSRFA